MRLAGGMEREREVCLGRGGGGGVRWDERRDG